MKPEVEIVRIVLEGNLDNNCGRRKVSSAVWKNLYTLTERGEAKNDFVMIKKNMQDFFMTFSELIQVGDREYAIYFMSPSTTGRFDIIKAMKNGIRIGKKKLRTVGVDFIRYKLRPADVYYTLSPIIVTRKGEYFLPPEIDFYRNLLGYLEIKYRKYTGQRINLKKENFQINPFYYTPVKISFQNNYTYGVDMFFKLFISKDYLDVAATLIQLGFGVKTGLGYGFIVPKRVLKNEEIVFTVEHPKYWENQKNREVLMSIV